MRTTLALCLLTCLLTIPQLCCGQTTRVSQPVTYLQPASAAPAGALAIVNQKRRQSGLFPLIHDPGLTAAAQRKAQYRASRHITGHDGLSKGGARAEGVGYSYGGNATSRFQTCYLYTRSFRYAGAAIARDSRGRAYYTLLLR